MSRKKSKAEIIADLIRGSSSVSHQSNKLGENREEKQSPSPLSTIDASRPSELPSNEPTLPDGPILKRHMSRYTSISKRKAVKSVEPRKKRTDVKRVRATTAL